MMMNLGLIYRGFFATIEDHLLNWLRGGAKKLTWQHRNQNS
jgi:hypothetical protein